MGAAPSRTARLHRPGRNAPTANECSPRTPRGKMKAVRRAPKQGTVLPINPYPTVDARMLSTAPAVQQKQTRPTLVVGNRGMCQDTTLVGLISTLREGLQ